MSWTFHAKGVTLSVDVLCLPSFYTVCFYGSYRLDMPPIIQHIHFITYEGHFKKYVCAAYVNWYRITQDLTQGSTYYLHTDLLASNTDYQHFT